MSDVNVIINSAPAAVSVAAAPVAVFVRSAPASVNIAAAPVHVYTQSAPIRVVISGARGPAGNSNLSTEWIYLVNSWTETPVLNIAAPALGGQVFNYVFGSTTYYRHVPDPYDPTEDSFYSSYEGGVLSGLISTKGVVLTP